MAVNSPGSYNNVKSPRSPRQLPQLPTLKQQPHKISGEHSSSQSFKNFGCKSPSTPRVFEFPPEYRPESPNANFDFDNFAKIESVTDSRSSLLSESTVTASTSNISSSSVPSPNFYHKQLSASKSPIGSSPEFFSGTGEKSPIFQFCNAKKTFSKTHSYSPKSPMSAGPLSGPIKRNRSPTLYSSTQSAFSQKSPKPFERARRNSCFSLGPIKSPMSPTTVVTAPSEGLPSSPRGAENSPKLRTVGDIFELSPNFHDERVAGDMGGPAGTNKDLSSKKFYIPRVPPLHLQNCASPPIGKTDVFTRHECDQNREGDNSKTRTDQMGKVNLTKSHGSLNETSGKNEKCVFSSACCGGDGNGRIGEEGTNSKHVARRSTSDLTELDVDDVETEVTILSSPRRRGSMKGGLAYLASRRGSRDSQISNISNVSNEDVGPLNFHAHPRGRQRRTSNFLELPVPDHIRPRVHSLPEKAYNPRAGDDLYRLREFSITHKGVVNRGDSIISRRSRSNTSVNSSRNSNVSGERSPFEGSCCSGQGVGADSTDSSDVEEIPKYRVILLGDSGVGKTALVSQFMTSEYMNTYDASLDDEFGEKAVSILLDGEESEMIFIDHPHIEMSVENSLSTYEPHGCVVVYSVESRASFQVAEEMLNYLWQEHFTQERSVIVVGNKSDLARSRTITANEGKQLATSRECKFIETSSGIQHNVDELLVGVLKQIRLRETRDKKLRRQGSKGKMLTKLHGSKTALSLNLAREILNKMCLNDSKSKSCENLHVL